MFDDVITSEPERHHDQDIAEFAMVGSVGISGHKTVWKEVLPYAPDHDGLYPPLQPTQFTAVDQQTAAGSHGQSASYRRLDHDLGDADMTEQDNFFFQAEDFRRAVNDWINFDMTDIL